ncbi:hypothetical protein RJ641_021431 [Dillenia turbinata]|uniref:COP1-interacting protein 7 n=1 Tax=Dillenia turbinata TaxID=194707 RepID=A0AAN8UES1_9MAGN
MKSKTRLDSAVFQLTPTRTRFDLIITANGKPEKIASGLLNPFLAQLKTAQDQIAKGGYSISLEPEPGSDATWFTKGTVERFVRFVNTPEVLERVSTVEFEILQIEEAIAIQSNNEIGISNVEDHSAKLKEKIEGSKPAVDTNEEKAIVLYKPGAQPPEANGSIASEGNSKVQLLKVLETRKAVLQKEQGMAFAIAVAAGFDIDHMAPLISFAECFGASRMMDACLKFLELWKRKNETGQWAEIEAAEEMLTRSEISALNASGIMLSTLGNNSESQNDLPPESFGKASIEANADEKPPMDHQVPIGQYPHGMYSPWPVHSPPGALPMFQAYPMQGMPYYQNYPANGPFIPPPYLAVDESRLNGAPRTRHKRHSMDSREELETWDMDDSRTRSRDDLDLDKEASQNSRKKTDRLGKKQSGMVVIRNINYITTKKQHSSGTESGSESTTDSETDQETVDSQFDTPEIKHKKSSKKHGSHIRSVEVSRSYNNEETAHLKEPDSGHWAAFQSCLLRDDNEDRHGTAQGMFSMEKEAKVKGRHVNATSDPLIKGGQHQRQEGRRLEFQDINGNVTWRPRASDIELLTSGGEDPYKDGRRNTDGQTDLQLSEIEGRRRGYRRTAGDDFVIHGREDQSGFRNSSSVINGYESSAYALDRSPSDNLADEYIVPFRSISVDLGSVDRTAIDMDSEIPSALQNLDGTSHKNGSQINYEPDDMGLTREQVTESGFSGYDPALEYEIQVRAKDADTSCKVVDSDVKQGTKKADSKRSKATPDSSEKKKAVTGIKKGKPSKMSPLDEARARAERLRNFKADLQKAKKEREEEELKRLEALKIERQKRIATRGSSLPTKSPLQSQQTRKLLPTKLSPSSHRGSKFSDSEPGALSPLQRSFPSRTASVGSSESKSSKPIRKISGSQLDGNRLTRSVSSLSDPKTENNTPDPKASMARLRRLSEPKSSSSHHVYSVKSSSTETVSKRRVSDGPEMKKISAIINLDRAKAATLPELKIKTSKVSSHAVQNKPAAKEVTQKANGMSKSTVISENSKLDSSSEAHQDDGDDNQVIEKTVVMLECEKRPVPTASNEKMEPIKGLDDELTIGTKNYPDSESAAIHAPASQLTSDRVDGEPIRHQWQGQPSSLEVTSYGNNEPQKLPVVDVVEKPYQAPLARNSSLEDPCTKNSEYGKAPPTSLQAGINIGESPIAHVSELRNVKLEKIPEVLDKSHGKDSSKGLRRLLKFGRKNYNSTDRSVDIDSVSVDGSITEDNAANTSAAEASRSFSLLSPFRSKTSEKKVCLSHCFFALSP